MGEVLEGNIKTINREDDMIYADLEAKGTYLPNETEPTAAGREKNMVTCCLCPLYHSHIRRLSS